MKTVALADVSVRFGRVQALDDVSLPARPGEALLLAGPNGAGKSTAINVLLGLVRPDRGRVVVDGRPTAVDNAFKARLGYLPESVAFAENLTGRQVTRFFAGARGVSRRRVDAVLDRVGLLHASRRKVRGYSRGMRQRLGLGLAILAEPELLVLDEPTGGLDREGLSVLWSVLEEWRERGRTVVMSSHDLTLLERRVDRLALLSGGRLLAHAAPADLRERVALPVHVSLGLGDDGDAVAALEAALRVPGRDVRRDPEGRRLEVDVQPDGLLSILDLHGRFPAAVRGVRVTEPGLDVVYEQLLAGAGGA